MFKLRRSVQKELLLLFRDVGGIVILFVMPLILLLAVTMVQKGSFDSILGGKVSVLLVDHDRESISQRIQEYFRADENLELLMELDGKPISEDRKSTRLNSSHVKISYAVF